MKIKSFKLKLAFSFLFVILVTFGFFALFLGKNSGRNSILLGLFLALALSIVLAHALSKSIMKPVSRTINKMAQDIEDRVKEAGAKNQELAAIFNSMIEGIIVVDKASRIVSVNPAIEKIFGVVRKEVEGRGFLEAIRNNDAYAVINSVLTKAMPLSVELSLVLPVRGIFEVNAVPIFDVSTSLDINPERSRRIEDNAVSGCLAVIHDITEIRRLETVRRDFVANVSHELKTPLTSIKGFVETLLEGAIDDKDNNRQFLEIIQDHAQRLDNLVNDLLSLSHLESKEIALKKTNFNFRQLVDGVISGFSSQLKKKNIEIKNDLPADMLITADSNRIEQVVTNLIDNAIKFNKEKGSVRIFSEGQDGKVKITVEDSGIGIPEKDITRIFERFYRVDKARSRQLGGTGLGLSIVKHIIELHGGNSGVESIEGLGSKFWFILPK